MPLPLSMLPRLAYAADAATRRDATLGLVVSERDYVSSWLATTRNLWRMLGGKGFCQTLPLNRETQLGCDGLIVLEGVSSYKYFYFEAKRLRPGFDSLKTPSQQALAEFVIPLPAQYSHFSDQLGRQSQWLIHHPQDQMFEMFLNFNQIHALTAPPFDIFGSTLVPHSVARSHVTPPGGLPVTQAWDVLTDVPAVCTTGGCSIEQVLSEVVNCTRAVPLPNGNRDQLHQFVIPELRLNGMPDDHNFMMCLREMGIQHYAHFAGEFHWDR